MILQEVNVWFLKTCNGKKWILSSICSIRRVANIRVSPFEMDVPASYAAI